MNENQIELGIFRDFENRRLGEPDDGARAYEAHEKRRRALEADLGEPWIAVLDWGDTKDKRPHELVTVLVAFVSSPAVQAAMAPAISFIGGVLGEAFKAELVDGVKSLIPKLVAHTRSKDIEDGYITLPDNSSIRISPDSTVTMSFKNGKLWSFEYDNPPAL